MCIHSMASRRKPSDELGLPKPRSFINLHRPTCLQRPSLQVLTPLSSKYPQSVWSMLQQVSAIVLSSAGGSMLPLKYAVYAAGAPGVRRRGFCVCGRAVICELIVLRKKPPLVLLAASG